MTAELIDAIVAVAVTGSIFFFVVAWCMDSQ